MYVCVCVTYLAAGIIQEPLQVLDGKVADTNVLHLARAHQLLHLAPRVDKVPALEVLGQVVRVGARRPVHQVQVNVVDAQALE